MMDGFHKLIIMGISASIGLTLFLFNIQWEAVTGLQNDVTIVRESVARIEGGLNRYWINGTG